MLCQKLFELIKYFAIGVEVNIFFLISRVKNTDVQNFEMNEKTPVVRVYIAELLGRKHLKPSWTVKYNTLQLRNSAQPSLIRRWASGNVCNLQVKVTFSCILSHP